MNDIRQTLDLLEAKNQHKIEQTKLPYGKSGLSPVMSSATIDYHYGKLYKGYVDRYNNNEGDHAFNEAGAYLHELFFTQFKNPSPSNRPTGRVLDLINRHWDNFVDFKEAVKVEAMKVQGSGWLYLAKNGTLKTIKNHAKRNDIVLLIDMWEHAFVLDYHADKGKYIDNMWRIINWSVINQRV
jgi:Fe-Mn family superoxide dismutase